MEKKIDYSFKVLEEMLTLKKYESREQVIAAGKKMLKLAESNKNYSDKVKNIYKEAFNKLQSLSFDEMKEIIEILASNDDE